MLRISGSGRSSRPPEFAKIHAKPNERRGNRTRPLLLHESTGGDRPRPQRHRPSRVLEHPNHGADGRTMSTYSPEELFRRLDWQYNWMKHQLKNLRRRHALDRRRLPGSRLSCSAVSRGRRFSSSMTAITSRPPHGLCWDSATASVLVEDVMASGTRKLYHLLRPRRRTPSAACAKHGRARCGRSGDDGVGSRWGSALTPLW